MSAEQLRRRLDLDERAARLVDSLTDNEAAELHQHVERAREQQVQELERQVEGILSAVPGLIRGRARKILLGGR